MTTDFDKEIDAILRRAREGEAALTATTGSPPHLDADEISAFAENALPEKAKTLYTAHLADCERCRKILSSLISLAPAEESEIQPAAEKIVVAVPWHRRFFRFPNLAYSLGALTLVFGGFIAFMILQPNGGATNSEVSRINEEPFGGRSAPAASNANVAANMSTPVTTTGPAAMNTSVPAATPNAMMPSGIMNANTAPVKSAEAPIVAGQTSRRDEDATPAAGQSSPKDAEMAKPQTEAKEQNRREDAPKNEVDDKRAKTRVVQPPMSVDGASGSENTFRVDGQESASVKKSKKAAVGEGQTTIAGGKTFRRAAGVWYDAVYDNRATVNVTRGTGEYKKLDKDLRVIVENLGGTVVIVWKGKAYRIR
jgi:hypothetical protein